MLTCKQAEQGVPLQAEQYDWLADTDEEIDKQELEAHYSYMVKIQEVPTADTGTDSEPLEQVQNDTRYNVFANDLQHSKQSESISNTCLVETNDSNVIPNSPDMYDEYIQNDQNDVESDDERVTLANLKLDVDENKNIQKQLKKENTTLAQELKEYKTILAETSKTLRESNTYQAPAYQASAPQTQGILKEDFSAYVKANDAVMRNMQTQVITTRSGVSYDGPQIPPLTSFLPKMMENEPEATKDIVHPTKNDSTEDVQPSVVQSKSLILTSEPLNFPIIEPAISPVSAPRPNLRPSIPYPSRLQDQKPPLADLGTSINLMPLSIWNKLSLLDLTPTCMTLELANRLISHPVGVAEDVHVKVGSFHFLADFVVEDFDTDPRVPLILGRSFLKTGRALIDVFEGELTLHVGKEAITFNLDQTSRYSANYSDMTAKRIDIIDMACEEYSQDVQGFSDVIESGNPTLYYDPIVSTTSLTLTPFGNSDFLLEEVDAFLALEDDLTSLEVDQSYLDSEGDILLFEAFLNDDPSLPPPNQGNYLPEVCRTQDLPPHLEYTFLEGDDKLPVIIAKDLSMKEKTALITVLKSHKRAIAWKLSDIKEVLKLLDAGLSYPISDSPWVSPVYCVPKKGGFTVVENEDNELSLTHLVTGWCICIDYRKLNKATRKDHFPLLFMDQMLERLVGNQYYCFLDGFSGYFQIPIDPKDQEKTTFTCPYGTFAYRRMDFGLCNALGTFQRCMMAIFHDMIKKTMEVFIDDFSVFGNSFQSCLSYLERMLKRCEDTKLCLN
nr:reverse transcriptase domain-containing protein [Tanacetum cinerariifolium]